LRSRSRIAVGVALHAHAGLLGLHDSANADLLDEECPDRPQKVARPMEQVCHRRAGHRDALPTEVLLEAVDRQVVPTLCDRNVCEEACAVAAPLDELVGARCGDDVVAALALEDLLHVVDANERRRHELPDRRRPSVADGAELR
jgi:hypothetical protein